MLTWLFDLLSKDYGELNACCDLICRGICGFLTTIIFVLIFGSSTIRQLKQYRISQTVREDAPPSHLTKVEVPTMGGLLILISIILSTILWADLKNHFIWLILFTTITFGMIGFVDDFRKLIYKSPSGLEAKKKFFYQSIAGTVSALFLFYSAEFPEGHTLFIPLFKNFNIQLGWKFVIFTSLFIVGFSNAVNLTDGLDGLAIIPIVMVAGALGIFVYLSGNSIFSDYFEIPYIVGVGEVVIFCSTLVGAGIGFLWFNTYPSQVFMGDIGSLSLGAAIAVVAVIVRQEIVLMIIGGIFVIETISVIVQVLSYKLMGRRIFRMAPLHHHFEMKGWSEPKVIVRFWIISFILMLIGLSTLILR